MMGNIIGVSICMITYGHEEFIEQAIQGVLMQETDFKIELIIANDCSPDATDVVVQNILKNNPKSVSIKYTKHPKNIGMMNNFVFALKECKGKYIAICEGDDYWTDPKKLQKQFDFLEQNEDYVIHSANAMQISADTEFNNKPLFNNTTATEFELKDFLSNNNIVNCTVLFRNIEFQLPKSFYNVTFGDWFIHVILMKNSGLKSYRSVELFSAYRVHNGGVMINLNVLDSYNAHILQIVSIHKYLENKKFSVKERDTLNYYFLEKYKLALKSKSYFKAFTTFMTNFKYSKTKLPFTNYLREMKHHIS